MIMIPACSGESQPTFEHPNNERRAYLNDEDDDRVLGVVD